jgi:hypothetical protein
LLPPGVNQAGLVAGFTDVAMQNNPIEGTSEPIVAVERLRYR